jgi:hypothetical protein
MGSMSTSLIGLKREGSRWPMMGGIKPVVSPRERNRGGKVMGWHPLGKGGGRGRWAAGHGGS